MSEYITETIVFNFDGEPGGEVKHASMDITVKEEIVRCRDCCHCNHREWNSGLPYYTCGFFDSEYAEVELDGFCAWGERREP